MSVSSIKNHQIFQTINNQGLLFVKQIWLIWDRSNRASDFLAFFQLLCLNLDIFAMNFFGGPYCGILRSFVSLKHSIRNFGAFNLGWFSGRSTHHWLSLRIWNSNQWFNSNHYHSVHTFTKNLFLSKSWKRREMKISQFRPPFFEQFSLGFSCCIQFWRKFQSRSRSQERDCCINLLLLFYL